MRWILVGALLIALAYVGDAVSQTVYRCKDANGTSIYSQRPCASDGQNQQEIEVNAPKASERSAAEISGIETRQLNRQLGLIASAEESCLRTKTDGIWRPANARIKQYELQVANLEADLKRSNNNLAGATWESGLREQISGLHQIISLERQSATNQEIHARSECASQRQASEQRLREGQN